MADQQRCGRRGLFAAAGVAAGVGAGEQAGHEPIRQFTVGGVERGDCVGDHVVARQDVALRRSRGVRVPAVGGDLDVVGTGPRAPPPSITTAPNCRSSG